MGGCWHAGSHDPFFGETIPACSLARHGATKTGNGLGWYGNVGRCVCVRVRVCVCGCDALASLPDLT